LIPLSFTKKIGGNERSVPRDCEIAITITIERRTLMRVRRSGTDGQ